MIPVVGHERNRMALTGHLPQVSLFVGPEAVGKRTLAEHLIQYHGYRPMAVHRTHLSASAARQVIEFASTQGGGKAGKIVLLTLDGSTERAGNILLKLLEEPPDGFKVILLASQPVLPTILSRSHVYTFGLLSQKELQEIYELGGLTSAESRTLASVSHGQVRSGDYADPGEYRMAVQAVVTAISLGDDAMLATALFDWDSQKQKFFGLWCAEMVLNQFQVFDPSSARGLTGDVAMRILGALRYGDRKALMLQVALTPILKEIREGQYVRV